MLKKIRANFKYIFLSILFLISNFINAQKISNVQKNTMRAPVNVKIDGRATEWNNNFQAYNKSTNIFYSLANDDNKLYLVIQATDPNIITKIILGGITFTIKNQVKTQEKNGLAITFPVYDEKELGLYINLENRPQISPDKVKNKAQLDSFIDEQNKKLIGKLKMIGIKGINALEDSLISIYNEQGIKASSLLDNKLQYTFELALPIKYLVPIIDQSLKFSYNIKINGQDINGRKIQVLSTSRGDRVSVTGADGKNYTTPGTPQQGMLLAFPTDFSGEYTIVRKK